MPPPRRRVRRCGAALLLALVAAGSRPPLGAHAQRPPPSIWLIGESLWMSTAPEPPPHAAALVLTDVATGVSELRFMEQFTYAPRECSAWWTDAAHDHEPLELTIREIAYEDAPSPLSPPPRPASSSAADPGRENSLGTRAAQRTRYAEAAQGAALVMCGELGS
jgi:hypothetical protein